MPADASIYNLIRPQKFASPMENMGGAMQLRALVDQQGLQALQRQQLERGIADDDATRAAYSEAGGDPAKVRELLYGRGLYKPAMAIDKQILDSQRGKADLAKIEAEAMKQNIANLRNLAARVQDDGSLAVLRDTAFKLFGEKAVQGMPASVSDPRFRDWQVREIADADKLLERLSPKAEIRDTGGSIQGFNPYTMQPIGAATNKTMSPDARANAVTVPGADGNYVPNTPVIQAKSRISAAGAPRINIDQRAEGTYAQKVAGGAAERDEGLVKTAQAAVDNIQKLDSVINHLKTSDAITGMGSDVLKNIERAKTLFLQSKAAGKAVSDTELLDSMLGSDVFPMIQALGLGAKGMDTPAEREFLRSVMTGTTSMNKDTLVRMAEIRRDIAKRAVDKYNSQVDSGELDRYFQYSGGKKTKIDVPGGAEPAAPAAPKTFNSMPNPAEYSGRRIQTDDGTIYKSDGKRWVRQK